MLEYILYNGPCALVFERYICITIAISSFKLRASLRVRHSYLSTLQILDYSYNYAIKMKLFLEFFIWNSILALSKSENEKFWTAMGSGERNSKSVAHVL